MRKLMVSVTEEVYLDGDLDVGGKTDLDPVLQIVKMW